MDMRSYHERHIFLFHPFKLYTTLIFLIFIFGPQLNHIRPNLANKTLNIWKEIWIFIICLNYKEKTPNMSCIHSCVIATLYKPNLFDLYTAVSVVTMLWVTVNHRVLYWRDGSFKKGFVYRKEGGGS